jgi:hypothetical protein
MGTESNKYPIHLPPRYPTKEADLVAKGVACESVSDTPETLSVPILAHLTQLRVN